LKKLNINPLKSFIILLNIAYLYNTLVWGQVDGIHSFFIFAAFLAAIYNRPSLSVILYLLALNTKLQSIVFLPPLLLIIAPSLLLHKKEIIKCVIAGIVVELIILSPFILTHSIHSIKEVNINSVDHFPYASLNAFNVWHLLLLPAADPLNTSDTVKFMNISYKHWGLVMFIMSSAIVLFPMLLVAFRNIITKSIFNSADSAIIFLTAGLIAIFFFFFNTQMHERYIHPAIILIGIYAIINKDYVFYFILSVSYVLNLEKALQSLHLNYNTFIFDSKFIASLLSACIIWGFYQLYCLYSPHFIAFKNQPKHNII
jgi:Gpi18-like mannosyltransferase